MNPLEETVAALRELLPHCPRAARARLERDLGRLLPPRNPRAVLPKLDTLLKAARQSVALREARTAAKPAVTYPEGLPITARAEEIVEAIRKNPVVVLAGATGSGKTTQIPKMCLQAGLGVEGTIVCTQPRRVAALSIARRVAEELKVPFGREVGAKIRFTDETSPETLVKFVTDGLLLAEIQRDPLLLAYDCVVVDEAHERSLNIDFLLGYLRHLHGQRPDLKIVITSATIDTEKFAAAFDDAPIIEVSGRTYPVEIRYAPVEEEAGDLTYVEAAVRQVEELCAGDPSGDVLVFLPTERDIREVVGELSGRVARADVLPLFGRLSSGEQQAVFGPGSRRRIIVSTNIAETSLTLPGIRYVVDTGLARLSRYSPHTRTQRLPIEAISRASADQRAGRCGRVAEGICVRLYSEEDYESRPRFTPPEIRRSNLADVILRMESLRLGKVEDFPFLDPPEKKSVRAGYDLLHELEAIGDTGKLTATGRQLARLPVDVTVGRMLLQARKEHALREVLVIAAGLSIQDPRERPREQEEAADNAHRPFVHPESDFLTLLKLWDAYHDEADRLSQGQLRKFCQKRFLNFRRMREWRDTHHQLERVLKEIGQYKLSSLPPDPDAIHRSVLTGLLSNVATKEQGNFYKATRNRPAMLFPGSGLFDRKAARAAQKKGEEKPKEDKSRTPGWIVCGEWLETTRLYAHTCAAIRPEWLLELGQHLLKVSYSEPYWEAKSGRVLCKATSRLHGLVVDISRVGYGQVDAREATEIFLRAALCQHDLRESFPFLEHNREVRARVEEQQTRRRSGSAYALDDRLYSFYARKLGQASVSSVAELWKFLREEHGDDLEYLHLREEDLSEEIDETGRSAFPDTLEMGGGRFELDYRYKPGEEDDGVTLKVPLGSLEEVQESRLDWAVPGYRAQVVEGLLRGLPKETRQQLHPLKESAARIADALPESDRPLLEALTQHLRQVEGLTLYADAWKNARVPEHLRPRIEIVDTHGRALAGGRDLAAVAAEARGKVEETARQSEQGKRRKLWEAARAKWEKLGATAWTFGDLPGTVELGSLKGMPLQAWPGLAAEDDSTVSLRLFAAQDEARAATRRGWSTLLRHELSRELSWLQKDLKDLRRVGPLYAPLGSFEQLLTHADAHLTRPLLRPPAAIPPVEQAQFEQAAKQARAALKGAVPALAETLEKILEARHRLSLLSGTYPALAGELQALVPADFLLRTPPDRLPELPRYLRAKEIRAERFRHSPQKDAERAKKLQAFGEAYGKLARKASGGGLSAAGWAALQEVHWLLEEYRVSLFAQELGTRGRVSEKALHEALQRAAQAL